MSLAPVVQFVLSFFNEKAGARRLGLKEQSTRKVYEATKNRLLIHCASYGEYEQIIPLIHRIQTGQPETTILLSFFSPSGYQMAVKNHNPDHVFYLPFDSKSQMKSFVSFMQPTQVFLVKYEVWPNLIETLQERQIPVYLLSARFYSSQIYFKWYGSFLRSSLRSLSGIYVQDEMSQTLLSDLGISSIKTGDSRADRVTQRAKVINESLLILNEWPNDKPLLVLGSIWPEDWGIFRHNLTEILTNYRLLVAPHEITEHHMEEIERDSSHSMRWSNLDDSIENWPDVIIMDAIGYLADSYRYADVAFIGGAFKQGLHNVLEPAVYGIPVIYGPKIERFGEAEDLKRLGGGFTVSSSSELLKVLRHLSDVRQRMESGRVAARYIEQSNGSTDKMYDLIYNKVSEEE